VTGDTYSNRKLFRTLGGTWDGSSWVLPSEKASVLQGTRGLKFHDYGPAPVPKPPEPENPNATKYHVSGNTFAHKDRIRAAGGKWDGENKVWVIPASAKDRIAHLPGLKFTGKRLKSPIYVMKAIQKNLPPNFTGIAPPDAMGRRYYYENGKRIAHADTDRVNGALAKLKERHGDKVHEEIDRLHSNAKTDKERAGAMMLKEAVGKKKKGMEIVKNDDWDFTGKMDGYEFEASRSGRLWQVSFQDADGNEIATGNKGHAAIRVFRNAGRFLDSLIKEKSPQRIAFTADNSEPSRVSLYTKFADVIEQQYGYKASITRKEGVTSFYFVRSNKNKSLGADKSAAWEKAAQEYAKEVGGEGDAGGSSESLAMLDALADILGGLYGKDALKHIPGLNRTPISKTYCILDGEVYRWSDGMLYKRLDGVWKASRHKPGEEWETRGRFYRREQGRTVRISKPGGKAIAVASDGAAEGTQTAAPKASKESAREAAKVKIAEIAKGNKSLESHAELMANLGKLTVVDLKAIAKEHNLKAPPRLKAALMQKLADHIGLKKTDPVSYEAIRKMRLEHAGTKEATGPRSEPTVDVAKFHAQLDSLLAESPKERKVKPVEKEKLRARNASDMLTEPESLMPANAKKKAKQAPSEDDIKLDLPVIKTPIRAKARA
jgi:hypothetical protein